ncbi:hypothetical protein SADUNF_Sadunf16G0163200 [Salix dunnii]|uniref:Uncharacterized protein n=1 Tax=Salix dunnii TaxID=1413687 RepID=A0A835JA25_9ROSI|nr:hypothetical protein SADUNF_Sadunf16G0163200 [Salix dunnii]
MNLLISLSLLGMPTDAIERRKNIKHLKLRAGYAADGVGAGGVTFSVACDCWGLQRESSRHLHTIGLPDFTLNLRCFQTVTCYQRQQLYLSIYYSICRTLPAVPHTTLSRNHIPLTISTRLSKKMGFEAAVEATAVAAFLNKAAKPAILGGQNCELQMLVMPSAKGPVTEHHLHYIGA